VEQNFQRRFSVNVWCGILGDRLVGPLFIDGCLNQAKYHALLSNEISNFLDEMPLAVLNRIVFHQDGATPHNARMNVAFLNDNFGARWMGTYGPIRWPARSPDLNPLDFFLWDYSRQCLFDSTGYSRRVKKKNNASLSGNTPKFFT
jgi:hypothetical protein